MVLGSPKNSRGGGSGLLTRVGCSSGSLNSKPLELPLTVVPGGLDAWLHLFPLKFNLLVLSAENAFHDRSKTFLHFKPCLHAHSFPRSVLARPEKISFALPVEQTFSRGETGNHLPRFVVFVWESFDFACNFRQNKIWSTGTSNSKQEN